MKIFAVTAKPVLHSMSPVIQNHAFKKLGFDGVYTKLAADSAEEIVRLMHEIGIDGVNVSAPFKEDLLPLLDVLDEDCKKTGAVNTILRNNGVLYGYNTDVSGVTGSLTANNINLQGRTVVILGAGGASKAAALGVTQLGGTPVIWARKTSTSESLAALLKDAAGVISTIPSNAEILPYVKLTKEQFILNAIYKGNTPLKDSPAKYIDGLEWLLHQAIRGVRLFTGMDVTIETLRESVNNPKPERAPVILLGMMGSGKSTVGKLLSEELRLAHEDLDETIENSTGQKIAEIFSSKGEPAFRALEKEALEKSIKPGRCISCGGGVITQESSRKLIANNGLSIWLWGSPETLSTRTGNDSSRPLLGSDPSAALSKLLDARKPMYASCADIIISTEGKTVNQICEKITYEYNQAFGS